MTDVSIRRAALEKWKQHHGYGATYRNLIATFERAGHEDFANTVYTIAGECLLSNQEYNKVYTVPIVAL